MAENVTSNNVTLLVTGIIHCGGELGRCQHWCSVDLDGMRSCPGCVEVQYHQFYFEGGRWLHFHQTESASDEWLDSGLANLTG